MKRVLGLDLGTTSIGWALLEIDKKNAVVNIVGIGTRIIPMTVDEKDYKSGSALVSQTAQRTEDRGTRRLNERFILRRDRLNVILNILKALPNHYSINIDFGKGRGQIKNGTEPKLAYFKDENGKNRFYFMDAYREMAENFKEHQPDLFYDKPIKNELGKIIGKKPTKIPYDWTLYYLRQKALNQKIRLEELAWVILSYNQKRGYEPVRGAEDNTDKNIEKVTKKVLRVAEESKDGRQVYKIDVGEKDANGETTHFLTYYEETSKQVTKVGQFKEVVINHIIDENGYTKNTEYVVQEIQERTVVEIIKEEKSKPILVFDSGITKADTRKDIDKLKGKKLEVIIETTYLKNGKQKKGASNPKVKLPKEDDWNLKKIKTDTDLNSFVHSYKNGEAGVSTYIYNKLLDNPNFKIKGGEITVISRDHYRDELSKIIARQKKEYPEILDNDQLFKKAITALYPNNRPHANSLSKSDFSNFIINDTIFYQRDLKSKKSEIKGCKYETRKYYKKSDRRKKNLIEEKIKVVPASNPYYQEFRLWQFIKNLCIYKSQVIEGDKILLNKDVTADVIAEFGKKELKQNNKENYYWVGINKIYSTLFNLKSINEKQFLKLLGLDEKEFYWNRSSRDRDNESVASKESFPANETRTQFASKLKRVKLENKKFPWASFLDFDTTYAIWHLVYSVKKKEQFKAGLRTLFKKLLQTKQLSEEWLPEILNQFETIAPYRADYGKYSEKALKKLLPLLKTSEMQTNLDIEYLKTLSSRISAIEKKWEKTSWDKERIDEITSEAYLKGTLTAFHSKRYNHSSPPSFLNLDQACYLVYNKHSEVGEIHHWQTVEDVQHFLTKDFKQHSLNNPVVENILVETMNMVCEIWKEYGNPKERFFNRIHLELARDLKKSQKQRQRISNQNKKNRATNKRIKQLLKELKKSISDQDISEDKFKQRERLKLYEEGALDAIRFDDKNSNYEFLKEDSKDMDGNSKISKQDVYALSKKEELTRNELVRYALWLEQRYQSPYTGKMIKLSDIFNREKYEIEHILPKKRVNLDAMYNKVLCETEVNKEKGDKTAYEFIKSQRGNIYCTAYNTKIEVLKPSVYKDFVESSFNGTKRDILLSEKIPKKFTNAQFNNTAYIGKVAMKWLSNIVRENEGDDYFKSKNLLPVNGIVTSKLRQDWLLNEAWADLVNPRFQRLNKITDSNLFGKKRKINGHEVFVGNVPDEIEPDFNKKRIDHRHHALDALVVALTTQSHIQYINNHNAGSKKDHIHQKLKNKLTIKTTNNGRVQKPAFAWWEDSPKFSYLGEIIDETPEIKNLAKAALEDILVSFKKKNKVVTQATNKIKMWKNVDGDLKKVMVKQSDIRKEKRNKKNWAVRKNMHEDTFYGQSKQMDKVIKVDIENAIEQFDFIGDDLLKKEIKGLQDRGISKEVIIKNLKEKGIKKVKVYDKWIKSRYQGKLDSSFSAKKIKKLSDPSIRNILTKHLNNLKYQNQVDDKGKKIKPETLAFSTNGIKELNQNIDLYNYGKPHKPVYVVSLLKPKGKTFAVGETKEKRKRFVYTAGDANVMCGIYESENEYGDREFITPKIKESIESLVNSEMYPLEESIAKNDKIYYLKMVLKPDDFVYLPTEDEIAHIKVSKSAKFLLNEIIRNPEKKNRIYRFNNVSDSTLRFTPYAISSPILQVSGKELKNLKESTKDRNLIGLEVKNEIGGVGEISTLTREIVMDRLSSKDDLQIKDYCLKLRMDKLGSLKDIEF